MPAPIDGTRRTAIEHDLHARDGRSRAQLARDHDVSPRTVQRFADQLGLTDLWDTSATRAATQSALDRRRAQRSTLADELLAIEIPRLRQRMAGEWRKTLVVPVGGGESEVRRIVADDAEIAKGLKELHLALGIAVDKTIAIDRHDVQVADDDQAAATLSRLFDGLATAYRVLDQTPEDASADRD